LLAISVDAEWLAGDRRRDGSIRALSGFNLTIADAETMTEMMSHLRSFLTRCATAGVTFPWRGINGEVDIGFSVGDSHRFAGGFSLSPVDIQAYSASGLGLVA